MILDLYSFSITNAIVKINKLFYLLLIQDQGVKLTNSQLGQWMNMVIHCNWIRFLVRLFLFVCLFAVVHRTWFYAISLLFDRRPKKTTAVVAKDRSFACKVQWWSKLWIWLPCIMHGAYLRPISHYVRSPY